MGRIWGVSGFAWEYLTRAGGPAPAALGEHLAEAGITWDCAGTHSTSIPGDHPFISMTSRSDFLRKLPGLVSEHLARAESAQPHLRASGRSLIGSGAVRLRSGRPLFLCVFDKDVLFTSVMTFFYVSIEMGAPSASFGVFVMVFTGRSRRGFPRVFTAWVCQGVHGVGFPRTFATCGHCAPVPPLFRPPCRDPFPFRASDTGFPCRGREGGAQVHAETRSQKIDSWNSTRTTTYSSFPNQGKRLFHVSLHKRASYDRNRTETLE